MLEAQILMLRLDISVMLLTDCVELLIEHLKTSDGGVKEMVLIILYNLSVGFRSKILTSGTY